MCHNNCDFRYSGATGSRQSSQSRDTESLQQSHHRAAYISIANAEVEDPERRVSRFSQNVSLALFRKFIRVFNFRQNESAGRTSSRLRRVSSPRGVGLDVQQSQRKELTRKFLHDGSVTVVKLLSASSLRKNSHINLSFLQRP